MERFRGSEKEKERGLLSIKFLDGYDILTALTVSKSTKPYRSLKYLNFFSCCRGLFIILSSSLHISSNHFNYGTLHFKTWVVDSVPFHIIWDFLFETRVPEIFQIPFYVPGFLINCPFFKFVCVKSMRN